MFACLKHICGEASKRGLHLQGVQERYLSDRTAMYSVKTITDNRDIARETDNSNSPFNLVS